MRRRAEHATIHVRPTAGLSRETWDEIWQLTQAFVDTERGFAEKQVRAHPQTVLFRDRRRGELVGMVSLHVHPVEHRRRRLAIIYTSNVLLREGYRGQNLIQRVGFRSFLAARLRYPLRSIYWLFDTFSYKSYLLLTRNFREYWPRAERPMPDWESSLMNHLAVERYGAAWKPERGIVVRSGEKRLRPDVAPLDPRPDVAADIEHFARANPGHADGDKLLCLCPLTVANWLSIGRRAFDRARRRR